MEQMYSLGVALRDRYISRYKLLSETYNSDEVRNSRRKISLVVIEVYFSGIFPKQRCESDINERSARSGGTLRQP